MPKITFVVPVYNKEAYIADCLDSLINQSLKDIEIIVVDDKSTDDSLEIIKFYANKNKRIKVIELPINKGRSYARNLGNSQANSPIICVQDADDMSNLDRAKIINKYFSKYDIDIFYSGFYFADANGNVTHSIIAIPFDIENVKKDNCTYIGHSTMAYKKKVILETPYSEGKWSKLGLDDFKLQIDLYKKGYLYGFKVDPLVVYRPVGNSVSVNRDEKEVLKAKKCLLKKV